MITKMKGKGIKCGEGYISQGEKCNTGTRAKVEKFAKIAGDITTVAGFVGGAASFAKGDFGGALRYGRIGNIGTAVGGAARISEGRRTKNQKLINQGTSALVNSTLTGALDYGLTRGMRGGIGGKAKKSSSNYAGPEPKREWGIGANGIEARDPLKQHERWKRRTKEIENLENSFKASNKNVENVRKLNRIYKGPSAKRDRKDSKKSRSVWAVGSKVTDGENYRDC